MVVKPFSWVRYSALALALGCCVVLAPAAATSGTSLPACGPDQVPTATTAANASGKALTGVVVVWSWGTSPCALHARLTFTVKRFTQRVSAGGAIRTIRGNPGVATVNAVLKPGGIVAASWRWRNWCGPRGHFQFQPRFGDWPHIAVPTSRLAPPACVSRRAPSTLVRTPVRVRQCAAGDLRVTSGIRGGFMQSLIAGTGIALRPHRKTCLLTHAKVTFGLQEKLGGQWVTLPQIEGNPGKRSLGALLSPGGEHAQALWAWRNWCSGAGSFRSYTGVNGRVTLGAVFTDPPSCQDPSSPSTLSPSFGHG